MTAAAAARQDLVFYTQGNQFLTHGGMAKSWPFDPLNRDLSRYNQNNFGPSKSYHVGEFNDFFGGYYKDSDTGFGHWGRYDEIQDKNYGSGIFHEQVVYGKTYLLILMVNT